MRFDAAAAIVTTAAVIDGFQNGQFIGGYHFVQKIDVTANVETIKKEGRKIRKSYVSVFVLNAHVHMYYDTTHYEYCGY